MTIKRIRIWAPAIFWIFQVIIHIIRNIYEIVDGGFFKIFQFIVVIYPLDMVSFGIFYYYFAPLFFKRKKLTINITLSILYIMAYSFVWTIVYYYWQTQDISQLRTIYFSSYGHSINYAFFGILFRMGIEWFEKRETQKELEKQNIKTELALLRAQINPHFLFNTLNNIHSFATQNSDKTSYAIIKLSEIMRYMLYEANAENVMLDKEIQYIHNYIELQKLRYNKSDFVKFNIVGETSGVFIPPMLFIPFIENAFKHGKKAAGHPIEISLEIHGSQIVFICKNTKRELNETEKATPPGIGIQNIRRRLEILYPNKHFLIIMDNEKSYEACLKIEKHEN